MTMYEMVTRRTPFAGVTATDVLASVLKSDPPPLHQFAPGASNELAADRYQGTRPKTRMNAIRQRRTCSLISRG